MKVKIIKIKITQMTKLSTLIVATAVATLSLLEVTQAKISFGFCGKPELEQNFDVNAYLGPWHEYARDKSILFEYGDCSQAKYSLRSDGLVEVHNSQMYKGRIDDVKGSAKCNGAHCKVGFFLFRTGDYRVLETDYDTYSVVYSCKPFFFFFKTEYIWILTRARTPDAATITAAENVAKTKVPSYGFDNFEKPLQGDSCKYLHEEYTAA